MHTAAVSNEQAKDTAVSGVYLYFCDANGLLYDKYC